MMEIKNAIIKSASLGLQRSTFFVASLNLDFGGIMQNTPAIGLCNYDEKTKKRHAISKAGAFILKILNIADVEEWGDLTEKVVRVKHDNDMIIEIGHVVKDDWLNFKEFFKDGE